MAEQTIKPLNNQEIAAFCSQMAIILSSGISVMEGVNLMKEDSKDPEENKLLTMIEDNFMQTGTLYQALADTEVFPNYMLQMVEMGENAGRLDDVMKSLSQHYTREFNLRRMIRNAILYPTVMVVMMLTIIIVLITKVMPIFNQVFMQLGSEMTGISKSILNFGTLINTYAVSFAILLAVIILFVLYFVLSKEGHTHAVRLLSHLRWYKNYRHQLSVCRFASGMSLMLNSGMSPDDCMIASAKLTEDPEFETKVQDVLKDISEGERISTALTSHNIFTGLYGRLISIGVITGTLDEAMKDVADQEQDAIDTKISNMIATIEPTLVIVLSIIVGLILLSVMLPLMSIMSSL